MPSERLFDDGGIPSEYGNKNLSGAEISKWKYQKPYLQEVYASHFRALE